MIVSSLWCYSIWLDLDPQQLRLPRAKFFPDNFQSSLTQENNLDSFPGPSVKLSPQQDYGYNDETEEYEYYENYDYYNYDSDNDEYNLINDVSDVEEKKNPIANIKKSQEPR